MKRRSLMSQWLRKRPIKLIKEEELLYEASRQDGTKEKNCQAEKAGEIEKIPPGTA